MPITSNPVQKTYRFYRSTKGRLKNLRFMRLETPTLMSLPVWSIQSAHFYFLIFVENMHTFIFNLTHRD